MSEKLTIWCNADLSEPAMAELKEGTAKHRLLIEGEQTGNLGAGGASELLKEAEIAFGQPDPRQAMELSTLRWVHLTSAGYTRYDSPEFRSALTGRGATMTNSSSVFDEPCAQHLLAFMLALARQLPASLSDQLGPKSWDYERLRSQTRLLDGQTVLILSFGAIARRLVQLLAPFNLNVVAVRRHVKGDEPVETHPIDELPRLLSEADHVVNILPANGSTNRLVNAEALAAMKTGAMFYNVGRGSTVDQAALIEALTTGRLGGAYLDVTDPEPLPSDHPLWTCPNCYITPHIAGGHAEEMERLVRHFLRNLALYEAGAPLVDRVI
ncbi:D-2-hydroxyacid dehydrogenase [Fimbriimonas ginsengisoli]|uniref:D-isomer specific 2-hydroxyacid dehydrogenase n=1 Tax=Fimbriimonas ginsengisoli Gsoil 348 TaxID=661478 RepID=A0A068NME6_FIMGI|nr:D-2-hydroxyacid dehydrogenase [Fimbriimonas ginsengisoli]AIE83955.1 D-isomer specific 2-hydroxyacid dehydrogenase [Fimbriimonas ginsengisoli Gsoil 348]